MKAGQFNTSDELNKFGKNLSSVIYILHHPESTCGTMLPGRNGSHLKDTSCQNKAHLENTKIGMRFIHRALFKITQSKTLTPAWRVTNTLMSRALCCCNAELIHCRRCSGLFCSITLIFALLLCKRRIQHLPLWTLSKQRLLLGG